MLSLQIRFLLEIMARSLPDIFNFSSSLMHIFFIIFNYRRASLFFSRISSVIGAEKEVETVCSKINKFRWKFIQKKYTFLCSFMNENTFAFSNMIFISSLSIYQIKREYYKTMEMSIMYSYIYKLMKFAAKKYTQKDFLKNLWGIFIYCIFLEADGMQFKVSFVLKKNFTTNRSQKKNIPTTFFFWLFAKFQLPIFVINKIFKK